MSKENPKLLALTDFHINEKNDPGHLHKLEIPRWEELSPVEFMKKVPLVLLERFIHEIAKGNEHRFIKVMQEIYNVEGISHVLCIGDMVSGYGEQGYKKNYSEKGIIYFKELFKYWLKNNPEIYYVTGNHDLGYSNLMLSQDKKGGPTEESVEMFEKSFNSLFYEIKIGGGYELIVLSSDLANLQERLHPENLLKLKGEQLKFFQDTVRSLDEKKAKIVLAMHDPAALEPFHKFLEDENLLKLVKKTFTGHVHSQFVTDSQRIMAKVLGKRSITLWKQNKIWKDLKMITVPSTSGMFGSGVGALVIEFDPEELKITPIRLPLKDTFTFGGYSRLKH